MNKSELNEQIRFDLWGEKYLQAVFTSQILAQKLTK